MTTTIPATSFADPAPAESLERAAAALTAHGFAVEILDDAAAARTRVKDLIPTSALTGTLTLPPATGSFRELGLVPVTATTQMIQDGTATGTVDFSTNAVTTTATDTIQLTSLKVAGLPIPVGPSCQTSPATITVSSQAGFNVLNGGTLSGTYTIPPFAHCGLATLLINLTLPGPGNTISLTLGKGTLGS